MEGRKIVALLMCVVVALIAASPLAQSSPGVHEIVKDEMGPPSSFAKSWGVTLSRDWTWHGHIVNYGLKWLTIDVMDISIKSLLKELICRYSTAYVEIIKKIEVVETLEQEDINNIIKLYEN